MITEQIDRVLEWLWDNKEWIFSGIGFTIISFIGRFLFKKRKSNTGNHQSSSFNIGSHITQVNGNYTVNGKDSK